MMHIYCRKLFSSNCFKTYFTVLCKIQAGEQILITLAGAQAEATERDRGHHRKSGGSREGDIVREPCDGPVGGARWYTEGGITYEYVSDYDILVITKSGETQKDYEVQDLIENRCVYKTPVTVITHDIDFINKMLIEGQYFYTDIEKEGILLYDAGNTPLAERKPFVKEKAKDKNGRLIKLF